MNTPRTAALVASIKKEGNTDVVAACRLEGLANQIETELATMTALAERLAEALEACQEDSQELLAEHSWWVNEPRCGYAGRYLENKKRIAEAEKALATYKAHKKQTP